MNEMLRRSYGFTVRAMNEEKRSIDVIASSTAIDSYGEIVAQDWDLRRYQANPVVLYGHNAWGLPIGHASDVRVEDQKLLATLHFVDARANPTAEMIWQSVIQGSLRAVSVGFRSKSATMQNINGKDVFVLTGNELIEISVVPIPANPEALATEAKAFDDQIRALVARSTEKNMKNVLTLAALLPILCLASTATEEDAVDEIGKLKSSHDDLLKATGAKTFAEAIGVVQAWKSAGEQVETLQKKVGELEKAAVGRDLDALIAKGKADGKLTPALEEWARSQPLETVKSFLEKAPAIPALAKSEGAQPENRGLDTAIAEQELGELAGKKWDELTPMQKHQLYVHNPKAYEAIKTAAGR